MNPNYIHTITLYRKRPDGATTASIVVPINELKNGCQYYCKIKDALGNEISTEPATLLIRRESLTPYIVSQPVDYEGLVDETAVFTVVAKGEGLTYQWYYKNKTATKWYASSGDGATEASISVPITESKNERQYYCEVTDKNGNTISTEPATLHVKDEIDELRILRQPSDYEDATGGSAVFTVAAVGESLSYQWYYKEADSEKWQLCSGEGIWLRTVLRNCFFKSGIAVIQNGTDASHTNTYTARIPAEAVERGFSAMTGDLVIRGECQDEITGKSPNTAAEVLVRNKPDAFKVTAFSDNTGHLLDKHYRLGG